MKPEPKGIGERSTLQPRPLDRAFALFDRDSPDEPRVDAYSRSFLDWLEAQMEGCLAFDIPKVRVVRREYVSFAA
jgi:hypothetical protein